MMPFLKLLRDKFDTLGTSEVSDVPVISYFIEEKPRIYVATSSSWWSATWTVGTEKHPIIVPGHID